MCGAFLIRENESLGRCGWVADNARSETRATLVRGEKAGSGPETHLRGGVGGCIPSGRVRAGLRSTAWDFISAEAGGGNLLAGRARR